jgi:hypothetical protein
MNPGSAQLRVFEFCFAELDYTLVRVEETEGNVVIRASDDTFSQARKLGFIRELAAEGFIPDEFAWMTPGGHDLFGRTLIWKVDPTWLKVDTDLMARHGRFARRLLVPTVLFWAAMVYLIYPTQATTASVAPATIEQHFGPAADLPNKTAH